MMRVQTMTSVKKNAGGGGDWDRQRNVIQSFQGLRALAIFMNIFSHLVEYIPCLRSVEIGANGVSVFIMLLGFCTYYAHENQWASMPNGLDVASHVKKKLRKFYPLHVATFMMMLPFVWLGHWTMSTNMPLFRKGMIILKEGLPNLLLIQSFIPDMSVYFSFNDVSWYLSDTMFFCLCTPMIVFCVSRLQSLKKTVIWLGILFVGQICVSLLFYQTELAHAILYISPFYRIGEFIQGCLLGSLFLRYRDRNHLRPIAFSFAEVGAVAFFIVLIVHWSDYPIGFAYSVIYIPAVAMVILIFAFDRGILSRFLSTCPFRFIGNISFELFLVHSVVQRYFSLLKDGLFPSMSNLLCVVIIIGGSIMVSILFRKASHAAVLPPG